MKIRVTALLLIISLQLPAQKRKTYFPVWTFQQSNICINGISAGLWNFKEDRNTVQLGIWNKNEKRKLSIINWNL